MLLVGVVILFIFDFGFAMYVRKNYVSQYPETCYSYEECSPFSGGPIFLILKPALAALADWLHEFHEEIIAAATVLIFIVTTALAVYTGKLWGATKKLVEESKDIAKEELRAYLGVANGEIKRLNPNHIQPNIEIRNTGKTQALKVTKAIVAEIRDAASPGDFKMPETQKGRGVMAPNAHWVFRIDIGNISDQIMQEIIDYKKAIFVWGKAEYVDKFGESHMVEFRFRNLAKRLVWVVNGGAGIPQLETTGWDIEPEEEGNNAT